MENKMRKDNKRAIVRLYLITYYTTLQTCFDCVVFQISKPYNVILFSECENLFDPK